MSERSEFALCPRHDLNLQCSVKGQGQWAGKTKLAELLKVNTSYAWHGKNNYVKISICHLIKLRQTLITLVNKIHHVQTLCSCGLEHKHCSALSWFSVYSEILSNGRKRACCPKVLSLLM